MKRSPSGPLQSDDVVLLVVPCLNEARHIEKVLTTLLRETDKINLRVVVADGGSTDGTRAIIERLIGLDNRIVLMDNAKRIQAAGINSAVQEYGMKARFLIRVDAHASYPERYCETLLDVQARTEAASVVVSMFTVGNTCFERAAAAAQNSLLGNGGSAHRAVTEGGWVEHGHHALMTVDAFKAVGGYDEAFSHNEDAELDARLVGHGFNIYLTNEVIVTYYPRGTFLGLFRQYFKIGRGRARNWLKHRKNIKLRHLVLVAVAPVLGLSLLSATSKLFAIPALGWALLCIGYGFVLGLRRRDPCKCGAGIAAIAMQAGWSFGFFYGLIAATAPALRRIRDPHNNTDPPQGPASQLGASV